MLDFKKIKKAFLLTQVLCVHVCTVYVDKYAFVEFDLFFYSTVCPCPLQPRFRKSTRVFYIKKYEAMQSRFFFLLVFPGSN